MAVDPDKKTMHAQRGGMRTAAPQSTEQNSAPKKPPTRPWMPLLVSDEDQHRGAPGVLHPSDVRALSAVWSGTGDADQQRRALIAVHKIAQTSDMSYRPNDHGGERDSIFAEGKRFVGLQMQKFIDHHAKFIKKTNDTS